MNIVKRAVARMGGEIKVESQAGAFTRFKLTLPLAGAITQGLLFKIGGQVYAVPAAHVIKVLPATWDAASAQRAVVDVYVADLDVDGPLRTSVVGKSPPSTVPPLSFSLIGLPLPGNFVSS